MAISKKQLIRCLREAQKGNRESLELVCKELQQYIEGYFREKFKDPLVVQDLSQETYLRFLHNVAKIREPMKLFNFVTKVAFHVCQDHYRTLYRKREKQHIEINKDLQDRNPDFTADEENSVHGMLDIENALKKLPEKTRKILQLKADGYKYDEIADRFNISVSGVKMQVKRSIDKLKVYLVYVTFCLPLTTILIRKVMQTITFYLNRLI